jgi:hypothetical protein
MDIGFESLFIPVQVISSLGNLGINSIEISLGCSDAFWIGIYNTRKGVDVSKDGFLVPFKGLIGFILSFYVGSL